jgi:hypothetical protein
MDTSTLMLFGATAIGSAGAAAVASRVWFQRRLAALQQRLDHVELQRALALDRSNQARQQIQQMQDKMAELQHTQRKTQAEEASRPRNLQPQPQPQPQPQRASAPAAGAMKGDQMFADTVVREPFPDTVLRQPYPETTARQPFPNTVVQQAFPNTVVQQPFPDTVVRQPFPDTVVRQPFPDTVVRQPFPDTVVRQPFPNAAARQPFPEIPKVSRDTVAN